MNRLLLNTTLTCEMVKINQLLSSIANWIVRLLQHQMLVPSHGKNSQMPYHWCQVPFLALIKQLKWTLLITWCDRKILLWMIYVAFLHYSLVSLFEICACTMIVPNGRCKIVICWAPTRVTGRLIENCGGRWHTGYRSHFSLFSALVLLLFADSLLNFNKYQF